MITATQLGMNQLLAQIEPTTPSNWRVRWNWDWPLGVTALLGFAAILWVLVIYYRENSTAGRGMRALLSFLRLVALVLAVAMFAQPVVEWFREGRQRLVVLVDRSSSMQTSDRYSGNTTEMTRIEAWQQALTHGEQPLIERWASAYELDVIAFDGQVQQLAESDMAIAEQLKSVQVSEVNSDGTRLGDAIDYALRELPGQLPVAMIVLTDGIATRGQTLEQAAQRTRQLQVPLYTVAVGSERRRPDIAIENLLVEEIVFPGDRLQVEATVRATGFAGKRVEVVLQDGQRTLAQTTLELPGEEETKTIRLSIRPERPGKLPLELSIQPQVEELNAANNSVRQTVDVRDEKIRVLMVQAQPSYEYRALKSLLERDPAIELHVVLQEADADYSAVDDSAIRGFPVGEQELFAYDVLILGDVDLGLLPRSVWPLVERFVAVHGGGMVGIAGPRFMPLAYRGVGAFERLLPMELSSLNPLRSQLEVTDSFVVSPTTLGWRTPSLQLGETVEASQRIWQSLPSVSWLIRLDEVKPGAQVLAEHPGISNRQGQPLPVILRQYVGAGEVLFHATDETWRWRWRTDDRYFARYWGQVVRRLGRGRLAAGRQGVQLSADRSRYEPGEAIQLFARFRNPAQAPAEEDGVVVQLQAATGPSRQVTLLRRLGRRGLFAATLEYLPPSEYEVLLVRPSNTGAMDPARIEIRQPPRELAELVVNLPGLSNAAEISGGKFYTVTDVSRLAAELPAPRQQTVHEMPARQLWNSHFVVALFVAVLTSEWVLRRRYGML